MAAASLLRGRSLTVLVAVVVLGCGGLIDGGDPPSSTPVLSTVVSSSTSLPPPSTTTTSLVTTTTSPATTTTFAGAPDGQSLDPYGMVRVPEFEGGGAFRATSVCWPWSMGIALGWLEPFSRSCPGSKSTSQTQTDKYLAGCRILPIGSPVRRPRWPDRALMFPQFEESGPNPGR